MHRKAKRIREASAALAGHEIRWWWHQPLVNFLHSDAIHREEVRLREQHCVVEHDLSADTAFPGEARPHSGAEILEWLNRYRRPGATLPPELTAEAIDAMRDMVGIKKGGRHGKRTAESVVSQFADNLRKKANK